jgi:hypothetical protein
MLRNFSPACLHAYFSVCEKRLLDKIPGLFKFLVA